MSFAPPTKSLIYDLEDLVQDDLDGDDLDDLVQDDLDGDDLDDRPQDDLDGDDLDDRPQDDLDGDDLDDLDVDDLDDPERPLNQPPSTKIVAEINTIKPAKRRIPALILFDSLI